MIFLALCLVTLLVFLILVKPKNIKKVANKKLAPFGYKLFYTDQNTANRKNGVLYKKLLFSEKYNIQGKPDFIYKKGNNFYIIELKSGAIKDENMPHMGDLYQLVCYFLIIEDIYGYRPKKGKLIYKDYAFIVRNTKKIRKEFEQTLKDMRLMLKTGKGDAQSSFVHCRYCMCKETVCEYYEYEG